jgi:hypothetical protein
VKLFKGGNRGIVDLPHGSQPRTAASACNKQKVDVLSTEDERMMIRDIVVSLSILHTAMQE